MTVIGSFAIRNNISDITIMIALGIVGWIASKRGFSASPIVLGLILGRIAEQGFVQSWTIGEALDNLWGQFFGRPISMVIIVLTVVSFTYPFLPQLKNLVSGDRQPLGQKIKKSALSYVAKDLISLAIMGTVAVIIIHQSVSLNTEAAVFPRTIAIAMLILAGLAFLKITITRQADEKQIQGSVIRMCAVPIIMLAATWLIPITGFIVAAPAMGLALILPAQHDRYSPKQKIILICSVFAAIIACSLLFSEVLGVALP